MDIGRVKEAGGRPLRLSLMASGVKLIAVHSAFVFAEVLSATMELAVEVFFP